LTLCCDSYIPHRRLHSFPTRRSSDLVNPDGSRGTCAACHGRHGFSSALARQPDNCGKCHMGPDHPQAEINAESKHGIQFRANIAKMNLDSKSWIVGKDYSAAPTCATC